MLFSNNNNAIIAVLGGAALLLASSAVGRENDGSWRVRAATHQVVATARLLPPWIPSMPADPQPAAGGGRLAVAAVPRTLETPRVTVPVSTGTRLGTFGSVAISAGKLPSAYKWRNATSADFSALFTGRCAEAGLASCDTALARRLRAARLTADGQSDAEALGTVNAAVNAALRYGSDRNVWGAGDYWATPAEIARKGVGDCEDFAIAKMWLLRSLGFGAEQLQLIVLQDTRKGVYHAVLAVHLDGTRYILDNLSNRVARDGAFPSYMPIMSFVGGNSYIHGFEHKRSDMAGMPKDLASVSPGEGVCDGRSSEAAEMSWPAGAGHFLGCWAAARSWWPRPSRCC